MDSNIILEEEKKCIIFGGSGFIGFHLARHLLENDICSKVILADIVKSVSTRFGYFLEDLFQAESVIYAFCDVRDAATFDNLPKTDIEMIFNLAAVHREPGHEPGEYFETNLPGAENVCAWAEAIGCNRIVFTSSIAPYGPSSEAKTEDSIPCPETAYGSSKLVAEKIHLAWQQTDSANRRLVIVRPGVVFGPGEGGNVTRLIRAVLGRYFFYIGNRETRKAGIYVKELCHSIGWALDQTERSEHGLSLYNATMSVPPSVEEYVQAICKVAGVKRLVPNMPYPMLYAVSWLLEVMARPLGIKHPFSPVRIRKLVRSNNIQPQVLKDSGYPYRYSLQSAFEDWKLEMPTDWV